MKETMDGKRERPILRGLLSIVVFSAPFAVWSPLFAKDLLDARHDETRTVYTIESSDANKQDENSQTEKCWEMLRNMGILTDTRQGATPTQPLPNPNRMRQ